MSPPAVDAVVSAAAAVRDQSISHDPEVLAVAAVPAAIDTANTSPWSQVYHDVIDCLTTALEARDPYTEGHSQRVADMSLQLAAQVNLTGTAAEAVHIAAHLHDIGKIGWPDEILRKAGPLSAAEVALIKSHPVVGHEILSRSRLLLPLAELVLYHHERWDGRGYPHGLAGEAIPMGARIIALCDSVDAMTSKRPYRTPLTWQDCQTELKRVAGSQLDPTLVRAALSLWPMWQKSREQYGETIVPKRPLPQQQNDLQVDLHIGIPGCHGKID